MVEMAVMTYCPYPVWYINLERDAERRERMDAELARADIPGERFDAVWWALLDPTIQDQLYSARLNAQQYYQPLVNGEKGCYASHIFAWRKLLNSDAPALVVLEDDVSLEPGFLQVLQAIARLPQNWDMIKLMGRPGREKVRSRQDLIPGHDLIRYSRVPSFTAAYVISKSGAQKMLQTRVPFGRPIDIDLRFWWENGMRIAGIHPPVVTLDDISQASSIAGRRNEASFRTRWRKLCMKLALSWGNARHSE